MSTDQREQKKKQAQTAIQRASTLSPPHGVPSYFNQTLPASSPMPMHQLQSPRISVMRYVPSGVAAGGGGDAQSGRTETDVSTHRPSMFGQVTKSNKKGSRKIALFRLSQVSKNA